MASAVRWAVNGTDLHATYGRRLPMTPAAGDMFSRAPYRGENVVIPGRAGEIHVRKVKGVARLSVPILLRGATAAGAVPPAAVPAFLANLRALQALVLDVNAPLTLTRTLTLPTGAVTESGEAEVEPDSLAPNQTAPFHGVAVLRFRILSGDLA